MIKILIKNNKKLFTIIFISANIFSLIEVQAAFVPFIVDVNIIAHKPLSVGEGHSLAIQFDNRVFAWGGNIFGQLGDGTIVDKFTPKAVSGLSNFMAVASDSASNHSLALKSDGTVWAWGHNGTGQLGNGIISFRQLIPTQVKGPNGIGFLSHIIAVATQGLYSSLALKSDGTVWAWGHNGQGRLGDGTIIDRLIPVQVKTADGNFLQDIIAITGGGGGFSLALKSDGTVWAWGRNDNAQLGIGFVGYFKNTATQVTSSDGIGFLKDVISIFSGYEHSLALKSDGTIWGWGRGDVGQLGDGTTTFYRFTPVQVFGLTNVVAISASGLSSFALKSDGTVWAWGRNNVGQLGDGTTISRFAPVQVSGLNEVVYIAGGFHSLALKSDGTVWAWGRNNVGQLGDGTIINRLTPVQVLVEVIDTTSPETTIISTIDGDSNVVLSNGSTASISITFVFVSNEQATFECSLDNSAFTVCTSPKIYTNLLIGNHTFQVRAKDAAGNLDLTPAIFSWTVIKTLVIFLPGLLGSWTDDALEMFTDLSPIVQTKLKLSEDSSSKFLEWLKKINKNPKIWSFLRDQLKSAGYIVIECPYDWRQPNEYIAENYLVPCINKAKQETGASKVNIVAHSMGGLTTRAYIQNNSLFKNDIDNLIMLGTPNHGSAKAYYSWEGGDLSYAIFGLWGKVAEAVLANTKLRAVVSFLRTSALDYIHNYVLSLQELLPTFNYLTIPFFGDRDISNMVWQNNYLYAQNNKTNINKLITDLKTQTFSGEGIDTIEKIKVIYPNPKNFFANPDLAYPDGLPIFGVETESNLGDETVLSQKSVKITEANTPFLSRSSLETEPPDLYNHTNLVNAFAKDILEILGSSSTQNPPQVSVSTEMLAVSLASPADLLIIDPSGKKIGYDSNIQQEVNEIGDQAVYSGRDDIEIIAFDDPPKGSYRVIITGNGTGDFHTTSNYAREDCLKLQPAFGQDNKGLVENGKIIDFTISLQGGCGTDAFDYALDSTVDIDPNALNLASRGNYITTYIELPQFYKVEDIDIATVKINNQISALNFSRAIGDYDNDGIRDLMVKFPRDKVQNIVSLSENQLAVSGNLKDGTRFKGEDEVRVINNKVADNDSFLNFLSLSTVISVALIFRRFVII